MCISEKFYLNRSMRQIFYFLRHIRKHHQNIQTHWFSILSIEEDIWKPKNLTSATVKLPSFTVVFQNYVFTDWLAEYFAACIHGSRLLLRIICLYIKQRSQVIAVKCLKCLKWKFCNCYFSKIFCASDDIFLKLL